MAGSSHLVVVPPAAPSAALAARGGRAAASPAKSPVAPRPWSRRELAVHAAAAAAASLCALLPLPPMLLLAIALAWAALLAPQRWLALLAAVLPLGPSWQHMAPWWPDAPAWAASALASAAVAALASACTHRWQRLRQRLALAEGRIATLQQQRDAARRADLEKSRFVATASHDLRQPVHALSLFSASLQTQLQGTASEPLMRNVLRAIEGLERLLSAMLDVSRLDAGTVEPNLQHFALRDLFRRLHMQFAGQADLAGFALRFAPGGKTVTSDPQLLERILANLIQNALKNTVRGGVVVVARTTATHINVEVWDTGIGMAPEELARIFDEFYQVGRSERDRTLGLGMGLAIVARLARLLGHTLSVSSRVGAGSMFRVGIPLGGLADMEEMTAGADTRPGPLPQARRVLVIEDESAIRDGLCGLLEEWGLQVGRAACVDDVPAAVASLDGEIDLILSDLHLGDGPDGIAAIEAARLACHADVPAVLITGDTSPAQMRRISASGHRVLFKPVLPRKLFDVVRGLVH